MKKTLTANISGTVFHIEEDAYDRLQRYLSTIRAQFTGTDGREEIMADIEARIAELFTERLDGRRQVVNVDDVEHVIGIMGQPEDYMDGATEEKKEERSEGPGSDWSAAGSARTGKRLFRDPEDKWVGGVLGGVGAYFNIDPLILRLIYLVFLFLGFGFILYFILWVIVPRANSAADMLQMRGEPVNVENLKRMFEEGAERFQQGAKTVAEEAEELGKRWSASANQPWSGTGGNGLEHFLRAVFKVVGKVVGVVFLIIGALITLILIGALIGGGTVTYDSLTGLGGTGLFELSSIVFDTPAHAFWFMLAVLLLVIIPAIGLFIGGFRLLTGMRSPRWLGWTLSTAWSVALGIAIVIGARLGNDFTRQQNSHEEVPLAQPIGQTLYLDVHEMQGLGKDWSVAFDKGRVDWDMEGLKVTDDSIHGAWAELDVVASTDSLFHLYVKREASGRSSKMALARASHTSYTYVQQDSLVRFSPWVDMPKEDKLRAQQVRFIVHVPVGRAVHFNGGIGLLLDDVKNVSNTWDSDMVGRTWTMTTYGLNDLVTPEEVPDVVPPAPPAPVEPSGQADVPEPSDRSSEPHDRRISATLPSLLELIVPHS